MATIKTYYYDKLNKDGQKVYYAMKEGLLNLQDKIMVPMLDKKSLSDIYFMVRMDNPEIFYTVTFSYKYYENSGNIELFPEYLFEKNKIKDHIQAMQARAKKLARQIEDEATQKALSNKSYSGKAANNKPSVNKPTDKEKELCIHDFIVRNVKYDKLKKEYSHEIIGALGNGVAVCEGVAKAVKLLCDELNIWCIIALSENNPEKGIKYRHAWNVIKIENSYYHFDATFDNTLTKGDLIRYDYFNLSDKQIFRDHEPVIWSIPSCTDDDHFYYKENKISWTTLDEVRNRTKQAVKKNKELLFHWRGGYLTKEVFKDIVVIFDEEAKTKGKQAYVSVNWPQAVIKVRFEKGLGDEQVEMEEANEGEKD